MKFWVEVELVGYLVKLFGLPVLWLGLLKFSIGFFVMGNFSEFLLFSGGLEKLLLKFD